MKTLLVVLTHPEAEPILRMNWPWLVRSGCDIAVVQHEDKPSANFEGATHHLRMGTDPDKMPHRWVSRFLMALRWFGNGPTLDYNSVCVVESDVIFVRPLPNFPDNADVVATLAGGQSAGFVGTSFWHAPWWLSRSGARQVCLCGTRMLSVGLDERGFIDRWLGLIKDLYPVDFGMAHNFSRNTIEGEFVAKARQAVIDGAVALHGVKSKDVLDAITKGL